MRVLSAFAPLIIGFGAAYLLEPLVARCQAAAERLTGRAFKNRWPGAACVYLAVAAALAGLVWMAVNKLGAGAAGRLTALRVDLDEFYAAAVIRLHGFGLADSFTGAAERLGTRLAEYGRQLLDRLPGIAANVGGGLADGLLGLVAAFYISKDRTRLASGARRGLRAICGERAYNALRGFGADVDTVFAGYIRGQLLDAAILGAMFCGALWALKAPFAVPAGVFGGLCNLVPYFGAAVSMTVAVAAALLSGEPVKALYIALAMAALQQIDAMVVVPRVIGRRVDLGPLGVLGAITVGSGLFGVWGMVFAVPVAALARAWLVKHIEKRERRAALPATEADGNPPPSSTGGMSE